MSRLDGKLAIIVGEGFGIGMLTVRRLAGRGRMWVDRRRAAVILP
jgi:NAD(P)-dependent dehydrogenase (short-subunit alcohol dehydrogenase family)